MVSSKFTVFRLKFLAGVHLGRGKDEYDRAQLNFYSDTLHAAICAVGFEIGRPIDPQSFTVSSAFPYFEFEDSVEYFFPKIGFFESSDSESTLNRKKLKRLRWLAKPWFEKVLAGNSIHVDEILDATQDDLVFHDVKKEKRSEIFLQTVRARVSVPRNTGAEDATPFYMEQVNFFEHTGLYFLVDASSTTLPEIQGLLEVLGPNGLGTDKSVGLGQFTVAMDQLDLKIPSRGNAWISLSLFLPENKEQLANLLAEKQPFVSYRLTERGGYLTQEPYLGLRKNSVLMFEEGAVFAGTQTEFSVQGKVVDLNANQSAVPHPIWRSGKSIFLPANL